MEARSFFHCSNQIAGVQWFQCTLKAGNSNCYLSLFEWPHPGTGHSFGAVLALLPLLWRRVCILLLLRPFAALCSPILSYVRPAAILTSFPERAFGSATLLCKKYQLPKLANVQLDAHQIFWYFAEPEYCRARNKVRMTITGLSKK